MRSARLSRSPSLSLHLAGRRAMGLALAVALVLTALPASAQDVSCDNTTDFPCGLQIRDVALQQVPAVFKFQSRVAQAKLPLGEAVFETLFVKLLRGTTELCIEQFANVKVIDSVLNLEIGRNMTCELAEEIAENTDLKFQICLGGLDNCLKPIELGSSPYAVKSSFASIAQQSHQANIAATSHYASRATADRDLYLRRKLGTGYFDFYTHEAKDATALYPQASQYTPFQDGGYLQWTPVRDRAAMNLHIVGKNADTDALVELKTMVLSSEDTYATGDLTVDPSANGKGLTVKLRGAHVVGASDIDGTLLVTQATTVSSGGIHVTGDSDITGNTLITGQATISDTTTVVAGGFYVNKGGAHIKDDSDITGNLVVSADTRVGANLEVDGESELEGHVYLHSGHLFYRNASGAAKRAVEFSGSNEIWFNSSGHFNLTRVHGSGQVDQNLSVGAGLTVDGLTNLGEKMQLHPNGGGAGVRYDTLSAFPDTDGSGTALYLAGTANQYDRIINRRPVVAEAGVDVSGELKTNNTANLNGTTTINGTLNIPGTTTHTGGTIFNGPVTFTQGFNSTPPGGAIFNQLQVTGTAEVTSDLFLGDDLHFRDASGSHHEAMRRWDGGNQLWLNSANQYSETKVWGLLTTTADVNVGGTLTASTVTANSLNINGKVNGNLTVGNDFLAEGMLNSNKGLVMQWELWLRDAAANKNYNTLRRDDDRLTLNMFDEYSSVTIKGEIKGNGRVRTVHTEHESANGNNGLVSCPQGKYVIGVFAAGGSISGVHCAAFNLSN